MRSLWVAPVLFVFLVLQTAAAFGAGDVFAPVQKKLVANGFSRAQVARLYEPPGPAPLYKLVAQTLRIREGKLNYGQFLEPPAIARAQEFFRENRSTLDRAEKTQGVDGRVVTAILLVETRFGAYTGKTSTLAVLSTFALMDQKSSRDKVWALLAPKDRKQWGRSGFDQKLMQRSEWAYRELGALLEVEKKHGTRAGSLKGSVMGAVGWPQFLPSSLVQWGLDGNGDGRIDLYTADDAILSVANYLRGHGWREAKTPFQQEEVIWTYNHSRPYVGAILGVAARLRELEG